MIKKFAIVILMLMTVVESKGRSIVYDKNVKTLQVVVNQEWLSIPVMRLNSNDVLNISFDELSHDYHRYIYRLEHCEADWSPSEELFESDWLEGFNNNPIEDYQNSLNTTVLYTHYQQQIPNDRCRLKMSGNYRLHIYDENEDGKEVLCAEFMVTENLMNVGLSVTTNTDVDFNQNHQQVSITVNYDNRINLINDQEQLWTIVMQNGREDNVKNNPKPSYRQSGQLRWEHNRDLIFEAGNEYHKYEILDVSHPTMGIDHIEWDGHNYQAYPFTDEPRYNYLYDQDANGAFYIRNSDNIENEYTCDYVYVNYKLKPAKAYDGRVIVNGQWTTERPDNYIMSYDKEDKCYFTKILQKQGYYSYQYLLQDPTGKTHVMPEEGSFFETENRYQALIYYKGLSERTWRLVGYQQIMLR